MLPRLLKAALLTLTMLTALSTLACVRQEGGPITTGVYADLQPWRYEVPTSEVPTSISFSNVAGESPDIVVATPGDRTVFMVGGQQAEWSEFTDALDASQACRVVVDEAGVILILDARPPLSPGDVINARRVE